MEFTLKDDARQDPPINEMGLVALNILKTDEYQTIVDLTLKISELVREELANKGMDMYDIKLEFGRDAVSGEIMLIDEISGGNMRVYKDGKSVAPLELVKIFFEA